MRGVPTYWLASSLQLCPRSTEDRGWPPDHSLVSLAFSTPSVLMCCGYGAGAVTFSQARMLHLSPSWEEGRVGVPGLHSGEPAQETEKVETFLHMHWGRALRNSGLPHAPLGPSDQALPSTGLKPPQETSKRTLNLQSLYEDRLD